MLLFDLLLNKIVFICISSVYSWPNGAPYSTCINLHPMHHGKHQQLTPSPYTIALNTSTYNPGDTVKGTHLFHNYISVIPQMFEILMLFETLVEMCKIDLNACYLLIDR